MVRNLVLFVSLIVLLVACDNQNKEKHTDSLLITQLIQKYPDLAKDTIGEYKLIRTVIIRDKKISLKLFSSKHEYRTPNNIIIINNSIGKNMAIPLFSNNFRNYWNFENEAKTYKNNHYNSLFEKELIQAINQLDLNDTLGTGQEVFFETLLSLLHFQIVNEYDKQHLQYLGGQSVFSTTNKDDEISAERRSKLNCDQIFQRMRKSKYVFHQNAYLDLNNNRVFQIEFPSKRNKKLTTLDLKVYRFGCEGIPLQL